MKIAIVLLTIIFISNLIGLYFGMYSIWWFDMVHHFLGGFFVAMLMWHYLKITEFRIRQLADNFELNTLKKYLILVGAVSFIGVVWEFAEYLAAQILVEPLYSNFGFRAYFIGDLDDTINDLLMDVLGAFSWLAVSKKEKPR